MPHFNHNTSTHWAPYQPSDQAPWNRQRVVHLHRRAGFGATRAQVDRDLRDGPQLALQRLLDGANAEVAPADSTSGDLRQRFETLAQTIGDAATASSNAVRLKAWWIYRMLVSPDPLGERLTLMWHNHFATSNRKVQNLVWMRQQNESLRQHARAPFAELLSAVIKQPAMLAWLDADSNRKGHANENLARELMELFTLGVGNYGEADVQEAARALTGWTVSDNRFLFQPVRHDDGPKSILGHPGTWSGDDLLKITWEHPATSRRLAWRLCESFMGEGIVDDAAIDELATGLREHELDIGWGVATLLRSERFFAAENLRSRVASPVDLVIGAIVTLDQRDSLPSTLLLAETLDRMGQELFYPPNVGGWRGGRSWLSSSTIIARANFGASLLAGEIWSPARSSIIEEVLMRQGAPKEVDAATVWLAESLWGIAPLEVITPIISATSSMSPDRQLVTAANLLWSHPENQLI